MKFKKRKDSFLGIHFDFHAMKGESVPSMWHPEYYAEMLDVVRPDFVQCDTKGHAGLSSYPTGVGTRARLVPGIDILKTMREETAARGIALYGHHSGIYDQSAAEEHPDWCAVLPDGTTDREAMSVFGPYCDQRLLPELRELAGTYHLDGAWVDGECWMATVDYSCWAVDAYWRETGKKAPKPEDPGFENYREFCREGFLRYVEHYVTAIHRDFPDFQITSNWIWSACTPESDHGSTVDFLSGDYSSTDSVRSARFHGRVLESRNRPWDLMAWGHQALPCNWITRNRQTKEPEQYCQEAAMTIAMGGAFECFNIHYGHGGAIQKWAIPIWKKMAEFCRKREICFKARICREFGVLFPSDRNKPDVPRLYTEAPGIENFAAWVAILQESGYSTKAILSHQLEDRFLSSFRIIAVPATAALSQKEINALTRYVEKGGKLLVDGPVAASFGFDAMPSGKKLLFIDGEGSLAAGETDTFTFAQDCGIPAGKICEDNIYDSDCTPAMMVKDAGDGKMAALAFSLSGFYPANRSAAIRRFIRNVLEKELGYCPSVRVSGSSYAELTVTEKEDFLLVNLINMAGEHSVSGVRSFEEIPPIGPLTVTFEPELSVAAVTQFPGGSRVAVIAGADGSVSVTIPRLEIHTVLKIECSTDSTGNQEPQKGE